MKVNTNLLITLLSTCFWNAFAETDLSLQGGPIMHGQINAVLIYVGTWTTYQKNLVELFVSNIDKDPWFHILDLYYDSLGYFRGTVKISQKITIPVPNSIFDGQLMSDTIVTLFDQNKLSADDNAVYFLLSSSDVQHAKEFCNYGGWCGFHTYLEYKGMKIKWSSSPMQNNQYVDCKVCIRDPNKLNSPNDNPGLDGMISTLAHELVEAITDPIIDQGWVDGTEYKWENADKCNNYFAPETYGVKTCNGQCMYNMVLKGTMFYIQSNWSLKSQSCVMRD